MNIILKTSLCFFLFIFSSLVQAETTSRDTQATGAAANVPAETQAEAKPKQYYIVEVVLFRHLNEQGKNDEFWSRPELFNNQEAGFINDTRSQSITDDMPALAQYDMQNKRFLPLRNGIAALSATNYKLSDSAAHLRYSPDFQLLAHFGWTQRSLSPKQALPIMLTSEQFSDGLIPSGELKLYVQRYLHLQVDLSTTQCEVENNTMIEQSSDATLDQQLENGTSQLETQASAAAAQQNDHSVASGQATTSQCVNNVYRFQQNRKMRSKELHYLDNPVYGMLVYVTPFTTSLTEAETAN